MCEEVFIEKLSLDNVTEIVLIVDKYETYQRLRDCVKKFLSSNAEEVSNLDNFATIIQILSRTLLIEVTCKVMIQSLDFR
ncbi:hypothetical protein TSAR_013233 [Trichomalopsis sarcophagae]|uniref:Uncharacterized protein n=1 Tax=Trichomalopsis sarcophagae TaxID=543379 RepID=A0A232FKB6_9HYME|nr:hypothetical protein TSAR_013233 [Trichomalopsis sarcophagae]